MNIPNKISLNSFTSSNTNTNITLKASLLRLYYYILWSVYKEKFIDYFSVDFLKNGEGGGTDEVISKNEDS